MGTLALLACGCLMSCTAMDDGSLADYIDLVTAQPRPGSLLASRPAAPASEPAVAASNPAPLPKHLHVTVEDAIVLAIRNNRELAVERLNPAIRSTSEEEERAAFDPVLTAGTTYQRTRAHQTASGESTTTQVAEGAGAEVGVKEYLPTGTTLELNGNTGVEQGAFGQEDAWSSRVEFSATQALLKGGGLAVNLVGVRQARIDTLTSEYELRGFVQELVAQVESTYWDCVLAQRKIEIVQSSLTLAEQQYEETRERIRIGKLAELELAAAEAEVALRREELINANSALETTRLRLLRLLNPARQDFTDTEVSLATLPGTPETPIDEVGPHIKTAMRLRPDLNQARLLVQRNELELVRTRNGLLPRLDLFVTLGATGYADSFGGSVHKASEHNYDVLVGMSGEFPPINREARAQHRRAALDRSQSVLAVANLAQLAEVDVRAAHIEWRRSQEQVRATAATRRLQEEKLRSETEKFRVGKSTTLLVAAAQRDLLSSQLSEVEAVVTYLKALIELRRLEGSLLAQCGVSCPGDEPAGTVE